MDSISTLIQLQEKIGHRQRVTEGLSNPRIVAPTPPVFPYVQSKFLSTYTKEHLNDLEKEFLQADFNGDGVLSRQEIKYWMEKHVKPLTEAQVKKLLVQFDHDKDQALDFEEFLNLCSKLGYKISPSTSLSTPLRNGLRNYDSQEEKLVQKSHSHPSSSGELLGKDADERNSCPSCSLKAVENPHLSTGEGHTGETPTRRQVSSSFHAQRSSGHIIPTIAGTNVRQIINYFEAQIKKLTKESELRHVINHDSQQKAIRAQTLVVSKNSTAVPPAPPPLPAKPLYKPMESTGTTLNDKTDKLLILKKSGEPSNANMSDIEPAQEAMELVSQLQRHSEPLGTGRETSYSEKRLMAEQRPLAVKTATRKIASMEIGTARNEPQRGLGHVFEKGPRGLDKNHFSFPKVYTGVKPRHARFTSKNKKD